MDIEDTSGGKAKFEAVATWIRKSCIDMLSFYVMAARKSDDDPRAVAEMFYPEFCNMVLMIACTQMKRDEAAEKSRETSSRLLTSDEQTQT